MWVNFTDMHSGGGTKTRFENIYIEADSEERAIDIFKREFNEDPDDVACQCCGSNFSVTAYETLEDATSCDRQWSGKSLELYVKDLEVKIIYSHVGSF